MTVEMCSCHHLSTSLFCLITPGTAPPLCPSHLVSRSVSHPDCHCQPRVPPTHSLTTPSLPHTRHSLPHTLTLCPSTLHLVVTRKGSAQAECSSLLPQESSASAFPPSFPPLSVPFPVLRRSSPWRMAPARPCCRPCQADVLSLTSSANPRLPPLSLPASPPLPFPRCTCPCLGPYHCPLPSSLCPHPPPPLLCSALSPLSPLPAPQHYSVLPAPALASVSHTHRLTTGRWTGTAQRVHPPSMWADAARRCVLLLRRRPASFVAAACPCPPPPSCPSQSGEEEEEEEEVV